MKFLFRLRFFALLILIVLALPVLGKAHNAKDEHQHQDQDQGTTKSQPGHNSQDHKPAILSENLPDKDLSSQVRLDEQLGSVVALDAVFKDETGKEVKLENFLGKPVVLLPVYFSCTSICGFLQADLAKVLNQVGPVPGKDFNIITLSFADDENESDAATAKHNYSNLIKRDFPLENWSYLTGDAVNIRKVTDSLGYYFIRKSEHLYIHPSALVVLSKEGRIIRYLYGPNFLPFDLGMALSEAEKGTPGISIKRGVLSFCFDYDPAKKAYTFKLFRITGTVILIVLLGFIVFLLRPSKKDEKDEETNLPG